MTLSNGETLSGFMKRTFSIVSCSFARGQFHASIQNIYGRDLGDGTADDWETAIHRAAQLAVEAFPIPSNE